MGGRDAVPAPREPRGRRSLRSQGAVVSTPVRRGSIVRIFLYGLVASGVVTAVALGIQWSFQYPDDKGFKTHELVVPLQRSIRFDFEAEDVIHSFWVPEWGQKQDAVPGQKTHLYVTPTRTGSFTLICTELCGLGHATM